MKSDERLGKVMRLGELRGARSDALSGEEDLPSRGEEDLPSRGGGGYHTEGSKLGTALPGRTEHG